MNKFTVYYRGNTVVKSRTKVETIESLEDAAFLARRSSFGNRETMVYLDAPGLGEVFLVKYRNLEQV